ncbi:MAG: hypothetical protein Q9198_002200 [Flavoplaca austrocitrina]
MSSSLLALHSQTLHPTDTRNHGGSVAVEQTASTVVEAGVAYGIAKPTTSHIATHSRLSSEAFLPRIHHSLTVVNGKAYIVRGETEKGEFAGDEIHIITLPVKGRDVGEPDYKCIPSLSEGKDGTTPGARAGHSVVAIGSKIYLFGGRDAEEKPIDEKGKVWVFDTDTLAWNIVELTDSLGAPKARYGHGAIGTELPTPGSQWTLKEEITNMVTQTTVPPQPANPHGTIVVHGGNCGASPTPLRDTWSFDIGTQTWHSLPSLPETYVTTSTLAFSHQSSTIYTVTHATSFESSIHSLPLSAQAISLDTKREGWPSASTPF